MKSILILLQLGGEQGHRSFNNQHGIFAAKTVVLVQNGAGIDLSSRSVENKNIGMPAPGKGKAGSPCVVFPLHAVCLGGPLVEAAGNADRFCLGASVLELDGNFLLARRNDLAPRLGTVTGQEKKTADKKDLKKTLFVVQKMTHETIPKGQGDGDIPDTLLSETL